MPHRQLIEVCQELELQVTQAVQTICEEQEPQNEEEQEAAVAKVVGGDKPMFAAGLTF